MGEPMDPAALTAIMNQNLGPFDEWLGTVFDEVSPDRVTGHIVVRPDLHQPYGIVHGGVYASLVETFGSVAATVAVGDHGKRVVGVANQTDFLRPVREGRVDIVCTPLHRGRLQHLWQVELTREDGKPAARGQLRCQVIDADRKLAGS